MILETVEGIHKSAPGYFECLEIASVLIFSAEYVLRVWTSTVPEQYRHPVWGRLRYMLSPLALVDLIAIVPFYLPMTGIDLRSFRIVRLLRIVQIGKLGRYSKALKLTRRVVVSKRAELLTSAFILLMLVILASTLMYYVERDSQPETFSSIPASMWWAVTTLSTVGYGDACPVTPLGKLLASVIAILGIGMFALPTGILGAAFVDELQQSKAVPKKCPHCGEELVNVIKTPNGSQAAR
jgi:voltage-gated potassium channel